MKWFLFGPDTTILESDWRHVGEWLYPRDFRSLLAGRDQLDFSQNLDGIEFCWYTGCYYSSVLEYQLPMLSGMSECLHERAGHLTVGPSQFTNKCNFTKHLCSPVVQKKWWYLIIARCPPINILYTSIKYLTFNASEQVDISIDKYLL